MIGPICKNMLAVAMVSAIVPAGASANSAQIAVQAELTAKANADTAQAVKVVDESKASAARHLARARTSMKRAYRLTQRVNAKAAETGDVSSAASVTARFDAAVDANDRRLEALMEKSSGRVESLGAKAMAQNVVMRSRTLLSSLRSYEYAEPTTDPDDFDLDGEIVAHAEAFAKVSELAESDQVGRRAQRRLQQGLATVLETQAEIAERFSELYARSSAEGKQRLGDIGQQLIGETANMRESIQQSGNSQAQVESSDGKTTLGGLAVDVEADVRAEVHAGTSAEAHGEAHGTGTISLPALP